MDLIIALTTNSLFQVTAQLHAELHVNRKQSPEALSCRSQVYNTPINSPAMAIIQSLGSRYYICHRHSKTLDHTQHSHSFLEQGKDQFQAERKQQREIQQNKVVFTKQ